MATFDATGRRLLARAYSLPQPLGLYSINIRYMADIEYDYFATLLLSLRAFCYYATRRRLWPAADSA